MNISTDQLTVWQALAVLGGMTEERSKKALRQVGMKKHEMEELYPEESMPELCDLLLNPGKMDKAVEEASAWMVARN